MHQRTHYSRTRVAGIVEPRPEPPASGGMLATLMPGANSKEQVGFGAVLRDYRVAAGLTQEALAERAGLSPRGISDLERGARTRPYLATVRRLGEALGLSDADLRVLQGAAPAP